MYKLFKGTPSQYATLHQWVRKQLGKPKHCENCGSTEDKRYEWANISGDYQKDVSDWARLCTMCHRLFDNPSNLPPIRPTHCLRGHEMVGDNIRRQNRSGRERWSCQECRKQYQRDFRVKRRLDGELVFKTHQKRDDFYTLCGQLFQKLSLDIVELPEEVNCNNCSKAIRARRKQYV